MGLTSETWSTPPFIGVILDVDWVLPIKNTSEEMKMPQMIEVVVPVTSPVPEICVLEALKLSLEINRLIDRVENIWDGQGGPTSLRDAIQNIIALARTRVVMWLDSIEETAEKSGLGAGVPTQSPGNVVASVGNTNSNNPVVYTAQRIYNKIKAKISELLTKQGKGGINLVDMEKARIILDLVIQRVKHHYGCELGIVHTNTAE